MGEVQAARGLLLMRFRVTLFGFEIFSLELVKTVGISLELDEDGEVVGGGAGHFERDPTPLSPDDRYAPWEEEWKGFGFGHVNS